MEMLVSPDLEGARLDVLLKQLVPDASRNRIQQAIRAGLCEMDGQIITDPASRPRSGQRLILNLAPQETKLQSVESAIDVLYEDPEIAICAKPAGLTIHPCPSCAEETFAARLLGRFPALEFQGGERPGIAHRLDKDTSGLIAIGLTEKSRLALSELFAERKIHKEYLALVAGVPPVSGRCDESLGRHPKIKTRMAVVPAKKGGREASTEWSRLWHNGKFSLLRIIIHTGRTHQIRVHLAHLGYPLLGDQVYAPASVSDLAPRQMLHAARLAFTHPFTEKKLDFFLPPPEDFLEAVLKNSRKMQKIIVTGNQGCGKSSFCTLLALNDLPLISADQIVAELYASKGDAAWWIGQHLGYSALNPDGSVNKSELFSLLKAKPTLKRDFEQTIHSLVDARIEQFWQDNQDKPFAVAEIPLYFESGIAASETGDPLLVGVSCPAEQRWQRIAATRGWSIEKIQTIESWQWPEAKKMAACDIIIDNSGDEAALAVKADTFLTDIEKRQTSRLESLAAEIEHLCAPAQDLRDV